AESSGLLQLGINGVAQRLAEEREAESRNHECEPRRQSEPWRLVEIGVAVMEEPAPARERRADANSQKAQTRLDRDHNRNVHAGEHEDRADDVGQHMMEQDAPGLRTEHRLGLEEQAV